MRPALMIGLTLALGATLWVSAQDDAGVEPVRNSRAKGEAPAAEEEARQPAASRGHAAVPGKGRADEHAGEPLDWAHKTLIAGVSQWQARLTRKPPDAAHAVQTSAWASMQPPPPPPPRRDPALDAPPAPVAPSFPYKWIGRISDEPVGDAEAAHKAVVSNDARTWVLKAGDVIEGQWRLDRIDGRSMTLTYLPLMLPQTVAMK